MKISDIGIQLIEDQEGCKLQEYPDSAGHPSIGIGHKILAGETFNLTCRQDAVDLLLHDLEPVEACINRKVSVPITQCEYDALCSFTFNEGGGAFSGSTLLQLLNRGMYRSAADEFLRWNKMHVDGQLVVSTDLTRRRQAEQKLFLNGCQ